jgi:hypothetical protein
MLNAHLSSTTKYDHNQYIRPHFSSCLGPTLKFNMLTTDPNLKIEDSLVQNIYFENTQKDQGN